MTSYLPWQSCCIPLKTEKGRNGFLCNYSLCWPLLRSSTLFSLPNSEHEPLPLSSFSGSHSQNY
ncbi:hypothetical protein ACE6H2_005304 [Prunus campanulata]